MYSTYQGIMRVQFCSNLLCFPANLVVDQLNPSFVWLLHFFELLFSKVIVLSLQFNLHSKIQFNLNLNCYIQNFAQTWSQHLYNFVSPARSQPSDNLPRVVQLSDGSLDILWPGLAGSSGQSLHWFIGECECLPERKAECTNTSGGAQRTAGKRTESGRNMIIEFKTGGVWIIL